MDKHSLKDKLAAKLTGKLTSQLTSQLMDKLIEELIEKFTDELSEKIIKIAKEQIKDSDQKSSQDSYEEIDLSGDDSPTSDDFKFDCFQSRPIKKTNLKSSKVCAFFQKGKCKYGRNCKNRHVQGIRKYKTVPCRHDLKGYCVYGRFCNFSHKSDREDPLVRSPISSVSLQDPSIRDEYFGSGSSYFSDIYFSESS